MNDTSWVNCKSNQLKPIVKKRKSNQCSKQKIDDHKQNNIATQKFNTEQKKKNQHSVSPLLKGRPRRQATTKARRSNQFGIIIQAKRRWGWLSNHTWSAFNKLQFFKKLKIKRKQPFFYSFRSQTATCGLLCWRISTVKMQTEGDKRIDKKFVCIKSHLHEWLNFSLITFSDGQEELLVSLYLSSYKI